MKRTSYFTFGQCHAHRVDGIDFTFDKDSVVKITSEDPRAEMVKLFGVKWAFEYNEPPDEKNYPRGVFDVTPYI